MSNSIWKTPKDSPRQEQLVAWVDRKGMHAGRFDTCYNCFCSCAQYFVDLKKVKRWCSLENLDDLIAQADKAERLQKAVDKALYYLDAEYHAYIMVHKKEPELIARVLKEIEQLIKENQ